MGKKYVSMQEELAARKRAAGYSEEPRAVWSGADPRQKSAAKNRVEDALRAGAGWAKKLDSPAPEDPFDFTEVTTDEEIQDYIIDEWGGTLYLDKDELNSWAENISPSVTQDFGEFSMDVSTGAVIIRVEYSRDDAEDPLLFLEKCKDLSSRVDKDLEDHDIYKPSAVIVRDADSGELLAFIEYGYEYFASEEFQY